MEKKIDKKYIECGLIINTHGIKGDVKIEQRCDSPEVFTKLKKLWSFQGGKEIEYKVTKSVRFKEFVIAHFEGIESFEEANLLRGRLLYALRSDIKLEEGSFFIVDLIGLPVIDSVNGTVYGRVKDYISGAASDLYLIETPEKKEVYIPAVPAFIKEVDLEKGIIISPIGGMFDEV